MADIYKGMFILLCGIFLGSAIVYALDSYDNQGLVFSSINNMDILGGKSECSNLTLRETAFCLNKELSSWWKYNESNGEKYTTLNNINWEVIKREGGVCFHSTEWYIEQATSLGFRAKEVKIFTDLPIGHVFALIWDDNLTGYCIIDQQSRPSCFGLGGLNGK